MVCLGLTIEFANGLSADAAATGELTGGSRLTDTWQKDKLKPLRECHGVHAERLLKVKLLRPQGFVLPETNAPHLVLNLIGVVDNGLWKRLWHLYLAFNMAHCIVPQPL